MPPVPLGNRTKMESTAALFPKQGSRAMGFGTDCGKERKKTLDITSLQNPGEHASPSKTRITQALLLLLLVCVSNMHRGKQNKKPLPSPVEMHILICRHKLDPRPLPKSPTVHNFMTMPPVCSTGRGWISRGDAGRRDLCRRHRRCAAGAAGCLTHLTL